ncbi:MAG: hypothetical protein J6M53_01195 [Bacteroidaceae bacterium]|nr:hypothetical protein [Bacteroidaceae bacterium]
MKHFLQLTALVALFFAGAGQVAAQDAFYVYRNDGDFNGFFFDQVVRMGYSKVDLDSVEHDVYVIQEIETTDSLYRIPLAAIDSIGFQQPEARLGAAVRMMDDLGHTAYFDRIEELADGTVRIYFKSSLPASLTPQVGDVLAGFDESVYGSDGFVAKVTAVAKQGGQVVCTTESVSSWGDLFERLVGFEQLGYDKEGNVRRRVAGYTPNSLRRSPRLMIDDDGGNYDLTLINWSGRVQYDDSEGNSSVSLGIDMGIEVKLNITYNCDGSGCFLKVTANENLSAAPSLHLQWSKTKEWNFPTPLSLPAIKFPVAFPIFETDPFPEGFLRIGGSFDVGLKFPGVQLPLSQSIIVNTRSDNVISRRWGNGSDESEAKLLQDDVIDWGDLNVTANGFVQVGSKVKFEIATNRWIKNFFFMSIGVEIYSGPKAELEVALSAQGLRKNGAYGLLKDSRIGLSLLSIDTEAKAKVFARGITELEKTLWSQSYRLFASDWYLFPDFDDTEATFNKDKYSIAATVSPSRQVFKASDVGIGLYDADDNRLYEKFNGTPYSFSNTFNEYSTTFSAEGLAAGKYKLVPLLQTFGTVFPVKEKAKEVEVPPYVRLSADSISLNAKAGSSKTIVIQTNATKEEIMTGVYPSFSKSGFPLYANTYHGNSDNIESDDEWLHIKYTTSEDGTRRLVLSATEDNTTNFDRCGMLVLRSYVTAPHPDYSSALITVAERYDTIRITQVGQLDSVRAGACMRITAFGNFEQTRHIKEASDPARSTDYEYDDQSTTTSVSMECYQGLGVWGRPNDQISVARSGNLLTFTGTIDEDEDETTDSGYGYDKVYRASTIGKLTVVIDLGANPVRLVRASVDYTRSSYNADGHWYSFGDYQDQESLVEQYEKHAFAGDNETLEGYEKLETRTSRTSALNSDGDRIRSILSEEEITTKLAGEQPEKPYVRVTLSDFGLGNLSF